MLDPWPLPFSQTLADLSVPFADKVKLWAFPLHAHETLFFFFGYLFIQHVVSPFLSARLIPRTYKNFAPKTRINWDIHVVAFFQSVFACAGALWVMATDEERKRMGGGTGIGGFWKTEFASDAEKGFAEFGYWERVFGYTGGMGLIQAAGCGYFLWDVLVSTRYVSMFGLGTLTHAVSAVTVFSFGFRPFVNYYTPIFMLYELSSPFLNIHWFCDKLGMTGSTVQLINGFLLLGTFAGCRLVYGSYQSFSVFYDVWRAYKQGPPVASSLRAAGSPTVGALSHRAIDPNQEIYMFVDASTEVPVWMALTYLVSNTTLNLLNWYWMGKMVDTVRKRFPPPFGTMKVVKEKKSGVEVAVPKDGGMATGVARGVYADGHKSVEVEGVEVRSRPLAQRLESEQVFVP